MSVTLLATTQHGGMSRPSPSSAASRESCNLAAAANDSLSDASYTRHYNSAHEKRQSHSNVQQKKKIKKKIKHKKRLDERRRHNTKQNDKPIDQRVPKRLALEVCRHALRASKARI